MSEDLQTLLTERTAKIGELMLEIEALKQRHATDRKEYQGRINELEEKIEDTVQEVILRRDAFFETSKSEAQHLVINKICEWSRDASLASQTSKGEADKMVLTYKHQVIKSIVEALLQEFPKYDPEAVDDSEDEYTLEDIDDADLDE